MKAGEFQCLALVVMRRSIERPLLDGSRLPGCLSYNFRFWSLPGGRDFTSGVLFGRQTLATRWHRTRRTDTESPDAERLRSASADTRLHP